MKIILSTIVRHDEDIIEKFIENNLNFVDKIYVHVHNPYPRIMTILAKYKKNRRVIIEVSHSSEYKQDLMANEIYQRILSKEKKMDIYFHLDADEFIFDLDEVISKIDPGSFFKSPSFILYNSINENKNNRISLVNNEFWNKSNYFFSKNNAQDVIVGHGQHNWKLNSGEEPNIIHLEKPFYFHFPWRTTFQSLRKITEVWAYLTLMDKPTARRYQHYIDNTFDDEGNFDENKFWTGVNGYSPDEVENFVEFSSISKIKNNSVLLNEDQFKIDSPINISNSIESQFELFSMLQKKVLEK